MADTERHREHRAQLNGEHTQKDATETRQQRADTCHQEYQRESYSNKYSGETFFFTFTLEKSSTTNSKLYLTYVQQHGFSSAWQKCS